MSRWVSVKSHPRLRVQGFLGGFHETLNPNPKPVFEITSGAPSSESGETEDPEPGHLPHTKGRGPRADMLLGLRLGCC